MCTAVSFRTKDHYFGRNLDLEYSYCEMVTITPRNYPFVFRNTDALQEHQAIIGMAYAVDGYPLYYDAVNESGLCMAGLNFPENAVYQKPDPDKINIGSFELIPWILSQYSSVKEVIEHLKCLQICDFSFSDQLPPSPLHWLIADGNEIITVECMLEGLKIYENPIGILTNNPPFPYHMTRLTDFMGLSNAAPVNRLAPQLEWKPYSLGMGSMGLPGDASSSSRFVRAAFTKLNAVCSMDESSSVNQFFHILSSVAQYRGCNLVDSDKYEITLYSCCCNASKGIYYYKTYDNSQISAVHLHRENLDGSQIIQYPLIKEVQICHQN